jgi:hypothetical protein
LAAREKVLTKNIFAVRERFLERIVAETGVICNDVSFSPDSVSLPQGTVNKNIAFFGKIGY